MPILRLAAGGVFALAFSSLLLRPACATPRGGSSNGQGRDRARPLIFDGRMEALRHAEVSNRIDVVIGAIYFSAGQTVENGDVLFELAPKSYEAAVLAARADLAWTQ